MRSLFVTPKAQRALRCASSMGYHFSPLKHRRYLCLIVAIRPLAVASTDTSRTVERICVGTRITDSQGAFSTAKIDVQKAVGGQNKADQDWPNNGAPH